MSDIVKQITEEKFKAYAGLTILPIVDYFCRQIYWFANKNETILGTIVFDFTDSSFNCILMGRDEIGKFRAFDIATDFNNPNSAFLWIHSNIERLSLEGKTDFPQGDNDKNKKIDLFEDVKPAEQQHPYYQILKNNKFWNSAKKIIQEIMPHYTDIDGNFIEQFQTTGFDQRLWELYLFNYFKEEKLEVIRDYNIPDFVLRLGDQEIGVEAVTISRKVDYYNTESRLLSGKNMLMPKFPDENTLHNDMPLLWGSALFSKLSHTVRKDPKSKVDKTKIHYWEASHMKDKPFVLAIQDFHDDYCMTWSHNSLIEYLYGYTYSSIYVENELKIIPNKITCLNKNGTEISSGFFFQELAENISAVIATPLGTLSKFNRLGKQAGFDKYNLLMVRMGCCHKNDKNANKPDFFQYFVTEESKETWAEGVSVFHNPNALHPLDPSFFPNAAHHYFKDGQIESHMPEFMPYNSYTMNFNFYDK